MRRSALLGVVLVAAFFVGSVPASADTTIGQAGNGQHCSADTNNNFFAVLQVQSDGPSYVVPGPGTLTSWTIQGSPVGTAGGTFEFAVWRPVSGLTYTLVFLGPEETVPADGANHTFALNPPAQVQAGDVIGVTETAGDGHCIRQGGPNDVAAAFFIVNPGDDPAVGDTVTFLSLNDAFGGTWLVNVEASFVASSGGGEVTVKKVVVGTPPEGTEFKVKVDCDTDDETLTFDADGGTKDVDVASSDGPVECEVIETGTGGANHIVITCDEGDNAECDGDSFTLFNDDSSADSDVEITVTNTFDPTAAAIVVQPTFTG
jgi:hypothetical protein